MLLMVSLEVDSRYMPLPYSSDLRLLQLCYHPTHAICSQHQLSMSSIRDRKSSQMNRIDWIIALPVMPCWSDNE